MAIFINLLYKKHGFNDECRLANARVVISTFLSTNEKFLKIIFLLLLCKRHQKQINLRNVVILAIFGK